MSDRTALITGATSGIGRATALRLAQSGGEVIIAGRNLARGMETVAEIRSSGGTAHFVPADLRDVTSAIDLATQATDIAGRPLDILINNAAIGSAGSTAQTAESTFDEVLATNLKAPYFLVGHIAPQMAQAGRGSIVNVSSLAAQRGLPGLSVYGASKAALDLLTKSWAAEYGPQGVRVNSVSPGPTRTPGAEAGLGDALELLAKESPLGFVAEPDNIAAVIAFLTSDAARFITGALVDVDGGRTSV
jgi:NAD(P)-dependent dehydrogenase (short-subunit alcohol dehydrogenase family)